MIDVSDASHPSMHQLNATEREVLRLLAAGHTAKSIATVTGRSVAAVNERLREARRKTGFGSSRELARALTDQENRDEIIGVAPPSVVPAIPDPSTGMTRGRFIGIGIIMTIVLAIAATLTLAVGGNIQTATSAQDVVAETLPAADDGPHATRDRFRREARDPAWAAQAEAALRSAYSGVRALGANDQPSIRCAATLCQVAGRSPAQADQAINNALMTALQERSLAPKGLEIVATSFATGKGHGTGFSYVAYFRRAAAT